VLEAHDIVGGMSRRGNCFDNAAMESWFTTVKSELGDHFDNSGVAKEQLCDYILVFYNQQRRHSLLGHVSPAAYERQGRLEAVA
jgi:putative transposase